MKVGVISDTHNFLDPQVLRLFRGVDHILHGGDIGGFSVLMELREIAPVTAVSGNTDDPGMGCRLTEVLELGRLRFLLHHIVNPDNLGDTVQELICAAAPDVVVFGHTHRVCERRIEGTLFLNPGYAGKQRFNLARTVAILHCTGKGMRAEFISL